MNVSHFYMNPCRKLQIELSQDVSNGLLMLNSKLFDLMLPFLHPYPWHDVLTLNSNSITTVLLQRVSVDSTPSAITSSYDRILTLLGFTVHTTPTYTHTYTWHSFHG